MKYDLLVIGGGPAGLTAAIHARARNRSVLVISNDPLASPLCKAPRMANYPGLPNVTGRELVERLLAQATELGVEFKRGTVGTVLPFGHKVLVFVEEDDKMMEGQMMEGRALILALGVPRRALLKGEDHMLGRGVSYCATCDGRFFRGKSVVCAGDAPDFDEEVEFLRSIGCQVTVMPLPGLEILGEDRVTGVRTPSGEEIPCDGVFLLCAATTLANLGFSLELEDGYIKVDGQMKTSMFGVYAAGDCTGQPLQLAKAVGQGQTAAHFALRWVDGCRGKLS